MKNNEKTCEKFNFPSFSIGINKKELNVMLWDWRMKINFKLDAIQNNIHPIIFYGSMRLYYVLSIYKAIEIHSYR